MTTAKPTSLNFDQIVTGAATAIPANYGGFHFISNEFDQTNSPTGQIVAQQGDSSNHYLEFDYHNTMQGYSPEFKFVARDESAFDIVSIRVVDVTGPFVVYGEGNGYYQGIIDPTTSGSDGKVSWTVDEVNGGLVLYFNDWTDITSVAFSPLDNYANFVLGIDDISLFKTTLQLSTDSDTGVQGDSITNDVTPVLNGTSESGSQLTVLVDDNEIATKVTVGQDGKYEVTDLGGPLHEGQNTITVREASGATTSVVVTVDTEIDVPKLILDTSNGLADPDTNVTTDVTPTIGGQGEAGATVTLYVDGQEAGTTEVNQYGNWLYTTDLLTGGEHTVTAKQEDIAGNKSELSAALTFTVALPGTPVLNAADDTGKSDTDNITSNAAPTLTGVARPDTEIVLLDGDYIVGRAMSDADGKWEIKVDFSEPEYVGSGMIVMDQDFVIERTHELRAAFAETIQYNPSFSVQNMPVKYVAGEALSVTIDLHADKLTAPVLAAVSDSGTPGDNKTYDATPTLTGTAEKGAHVVVYENGNVVAEADADAQTGAWSATVTNALSVGAHNLSATQTDIAGNTSGTGDTLTLTIEQIALQLTDASDSGTKGDGITSDATPVLSGTAAPGAELTVKVDDNAVGSKVTVGQDGKYEVTDLGGPLADGSHTIKVVDAAGGISTIDIVVDTTADKPTIKLDQEFVIDGTGTNVTTDVTPLLTGLGEAGATVRVYMDGDFPIGSARVDDLGRWQLTTGILPAGEHVFTAQQTDVAGNVSDLSIELPVTIALPGAPVLAEASDTHIDVTGQPFTRDNITSATTLALSGVARPDTDIVILDGNYIVGRGHTDADGKWTIANVDLYDREPVDGIISTLANPVSIEGEHQLRVAFAETFQYGRSADPFQYIAGAPLTVTIDLHADALVAPTLLATSDSGTKGDFKTNIATPTLTGTAEKGAYVEVREGDTVVGHGYANKETGVWTIQTSTLKVGVRDLVAYQTDVAGNKSEAGAALTLTIEQAPIVSNPPTTVDGVDVITAPVTTPGGNTGTSIVVPVVTPGRTEQSGDASTADIPLSSQSGQSLLTAKVHTGYGLTANGGIVQGNASSLAELIAAIKATGETNQISDVTHLTDGGTSFLSLLPNDSSLLVQTIRLAGSSTDGSALDLVGNPDTRAAIVLDGTQLPAGSHITLTDIPFAAVFGAVHVTGTTTGQILTGDLSGQTFVVGTGASSLVLSGGGADTLQFGVGASAGASAADGQATASTTLLHGGTEADVAVFNGKAADFTIEQHDGYVLVSANSAPEQVAKVVNVESLQFSDQTIAVASRAELTTLAGLYETVLGRQADVGGFDFWGSVEKAGNSLGTIAVEMLKTTEAVAHFGTLTGDAGHDVAILYQALFSRAADAAGQAFWVEQMAHGSTLAQVADQMAHSAEIVGHQLANTAWDFSV